MAQRFNLTDDARTVLLLVIGVAVLVFGALAWIGVTQWQRYDSSLSRAEPLIARLTGALQSANDMTVALDATTVQIGRYAYPAQGDLSRTESEYQAQVRNILQTSGLEIAGTQQLPARAGDGYDEMGLNVNVNGDVSNLQTALTMLRGQTPHIRIEQMRVQPINRGATPSAQIINVQMILIAVRLREA